MKVMARGASASALRAKGDQKGVGRMRQGAYSTPFWGKSTRQVLCTAQLPLWMSCTGGHKCYSNNRKDAISVKHARLRIVCESWLPWQGMH